MSENRFIVENDNNEVSIKDKVKDNYPFALAYEHIDDADNLIQECLSLVVLLNEQQSTISALKEENDILKQKLRKNYIANKQYEEMKRLQEENEQLKQELRGMNELLESYRETIKHDAELLADATRNGYLPPLEDFVKR